MPDEPVDDPRHTPQSGITFIVSDESIIERARVLQSSIEKVEMRWVTARGEGVERPAVLVIDADDPSGRAILATSGADERVRAHVAAAHRLGRMPITTCGLHRKVVQDLVRAEFGDFDSIVDAETGDGYPAVVVAAGGFSVFVMPPVPA